MIRQGENREVSPFDTSSEEATHVDEGLWIGVKGTKLVSIDAMDRALKETVFHEPNGEVTGKTGPSHEFRLHLVDEHMDISSLQAKKTNLVVVLNHGTMCFHELHGPLVVSLLSFGNGPGRLEETDVESVEQLVIGLDDLRFNVGPPELLVVKALPIPCEELCLVVDVCTCLCSSCSP